MSRSKPPHSAVTLGADRQEAAKRSRLLFMSLACCLVRKIELVLSDVDGVMTDGGIQILDDGQQFLKFHIRDGMGVRLWREAGKRFGIVTGRNLEAVSGGRPIFGSISSRWASTTSCRRWMRSPPT